MATVRDRLDALTKAAGERGLTPRAWWLGRDHHDDVREAVADDPSTRVEAGRLVELEGLEVKLLSESPDRFALFCDEGILDL